MHRDAFAFVQGGELSDPRALSCEGTLSTMKFYFACNFLCSLLLLVALTSAARATGPRINRTRRFTVADIGSALNRVGETVKNTVKAGLDSLFNQSTELETTTEPTTTEANTTGVPRNIIDSPIRCPPDHILVNGRCRLASRRR